MPSPIDKRICPGCGRRCGRWGCRSCNYDGDIPTTREVLVGDVGRFSDVDLAAYVRSLLRDVRQHEGW